MDRAAFYEYWDASLQKISVDETVREHLMAIVELKFLPPIFTRLLGPFHAFVTTGFLPQHFRRELRLDWTPRQQRRFDLVMRVVAAIVRRSPRPLREFPFNIYLWRRRRRRLRRGLSLV